MGEPHKGVMLLRARTRAPWRTSALEALAQCVAKRYVDLPMQRHRPLRGTAHSQAPQHLVHQRRQTLASRRRARRGHVENAYPIGRAILAEGCPARTAWHSRTYMILAAAIAVKLVLNGVVPRLSPVRMSVHLHTPEDCVPTTQRSKNAPGISPVIGAGVLESRCHRHWRSHWK